ncbi:MAG: inositol monophosphatase family protein [Dehalococcoidia bacterium]
MSELLEIAELAALRSGRMLLHYQDQGNLQVKYKDQHNIVTEADKKSEDLILSIIQRAYPEHAIFSEEAGGMVTANGYLWVVDPLDGTTNFAHNLPHYAVSIALLHDGVPVVGVVYNPVRDELFTAERGEGALLNGQIIEPSAISHLETAVVIANRGSDPAEKLRFGHIFKVLTEHVRSIRVPGATALDLCYVASGRFDAIINNGCEFYDCAAGNLVAMESGAVVTDFEQRSWKCERSDLLVAPESIHGYLTDVVKNL